MTDPSKEIVHIEASLKGFEPAANASLCQDVIPIQLQGTKSDWDIETLRALINIKMRLEDSSAEWNCIIVELMKIVSSSQDVGKERVLLASVALVNVMFRSFPAEDFYSQLKTCWNLENPILTAFGQDFKIRDLEWFKLVLTHGYLLTNIKSIYTPDLLSLLFEVLRKNCLTYTKYSYFAYKPLQNWLHKTTTTEFWTAIDTTATEKDLEAIIFANWDSCICEISRRNSTQIFPMYLTIMSRKYDGFLEFIFESCVQSLSWQNKIKYTILVEVCRIWDDVEKIIDSELPSCLFTSLTRDDMKHEGTKLYLTILEKLKPNQWEEIFGDSFLSTTVAWESDEQTTAIDLVWEQWMKPTFVKFPNVFEFLWKKFNDSTKRLTLNRSYLERMGHQQDFSIICESEIDVGDILSNRVTHSSEPVRLNAFAILCQFKNWKKLDSSTSSPFTTLKRFLYFNIGTSSAIMRKGIVKNFEILFSNLVRATNKDSNIEPYVRDFLEWLHEFLLDCFELRSCYQRKILGLKLYEVVLALTCNVDIPDGKKSTLERKKLISCATNLRRKMSGEEKWLFCDSRSTRIMYALVYDPIGEIREKATSMLLDYFSMEALPREEIEHTWKTNDAYRDSVNFYEVAIGATVIKIKTLWDPEWKSSRSDHRLSTVEDHIRLAESQLSIVKADSASHEGRLDRLLYGATIYGSLTVILDVGFLSGSSSEKIFDEPAKCKILDLVEDVTQFLLLRQTNSTDDVNLTSKDNAEEKDTEDCTLSAKDQLIASCLCMSLKVSCDIAAEVGLIAESEKCAERAVDLIVSVLLRCRYKAAIAAAGTALGKLTKTLSKGKYNQLLESKLTDLIDGENAKNIKLTRRGAGLTIMFHKIVSNDDRRNSPWLHMAVNKLLHALTSNSEDEPIFRDGALMDSPRARRLHFLRSLVADKQLQAQLVSYIEDICLTCFRHLQSKDWPVHNASLNLFGAVVPRLVGQCDGRELDGNTVDHFVTHFPLLAETVMSELKSLVKTFKTGSKKDCSMIHVKSNVMPILTLLSKMSCGGCDLIDYSSRKYLSEAKEAYDVLLEHPVINVRVLAGKAYTAFTPFADIPEELAKLQLRSLSEDFKKMENRQHGLLCLQLYLLRKFKKEKRCTSSTFSIEKHKKWEALMDEGSRLQLRQLGRSLDRWLKRQEHMSYIVQSALISCLLESPTCFSGEDLPLNWSHTNVAIRTMLEERTKPGFSEFFNKLASLTARLNIVHDTTSLSEMIITGNPSLEHAMTIIKNLPVEARNLGIFVKTAWAIFDNHAKSRSLLRIVRYIKDIVYNIDDLHKELSEKLIEEVHRLSEKLVDIRRRSRPYDEQLRNFGFCIALRIRKYEKIQSPVQNQSESRYSAICAIAEGIYEEDPAVKNSSIECLLSTVSCCDSSIEERCDFILDLQEDSHKVLIESIVSLLVLDEPNARESTAKTLQVLPAGLIGDSEEPLCAKARVFRIINNTMRTIDKNRGTLLNVLTILERLASRVKLCPPTGDFDSPYQQDEAFDRDITSYLNLLFYCVKRIETKLTLDGSESETSSIDSEEGFEMEQINGAINAKYRIQREINRKFDNIRDFMTIDASDYLMDKKCFLIETIEHLRNKLLRS